MNVTTTPQRYSLEHLLAELRRISALVSLRVQEMRTANPAEEDEFRGLYVSEEEVDQLLADPHLFLASGYDASLRAEQAMPSYPALSRLRHLQNVFGLSAFELDVVLIALAPELDLRYERIYAYLQDDVTRRRPGIDLALRLLCPGLAAQVAARRCFDSEAPLLRYRLLELSEENQNRATSLLARSIKLDEGLVAYLLGEDKLDARLRSLTDFGPPPTEGASFLFAEAERYVPRLVELAEDGYVCVLVGSDEASKRYLAAEVGRQLSRPVIRLDAALLPGLPKAESQLRLLERDCRLHRAIFYLANYDAIFLKEEGPVLEAQRLVTRLLENQTADGLSMISSLQTLPPALGGNRREFQLVLNMPGYTERQRLWEQELGAEALGLDLEGLSSRFRLSSGQIVAAAATARHLTSWRGETSPTLADLEAACRAHSSQRLSSLARKMRTSYRWEDLVLPPDQFNMLREICEQVKHRSLVYGKWGFDAKLSLGKGLNIIFAGPSGTGKTMSAEIIGGELKMDVYKIDLSNMVSKYIGETEKNLERIFTEAGESNAILFFDEADALFGKRSEVKDAHDRYANIETGYLLQKMEEYDGIVILATNLRKNLDDAFVRRMHFMLEYPFPEEDDRYEIWRRAFPKETPLGDTIDLRFMARQFKITGGNIKNIALASAFLAAGENSAVEMQHLIRSTRREFQKMGKLCTQTDFGPYFYLVNESDPKARKSPISR